MIEAELRRDLDAPHKSDRVAALEGVLRSGASEALLLVLLERQKVEDDEECRRLLSYAVISVQRRLSGEKAVSSSVPDETQFQVRFSEADERGRLTLLSQISPEGAKRFAGISDELIAAEKSPLVAAALLRTFSPHWPPDKCGKLPEFLVSESLSVRLAALEVLSVRHPDLLVGFLPKLLTSTDPRIRALAIRGLASIDLAEALEYLQALLLSKENADKIAALRNCFFLPFEEIKPLLLKFFAAESNPDLLKRGGLLVETNPDPQVPFQLWELAERSEERKSAVLKEVAQGACRIIEQSGILGDGYSTYQENLQKWILQRKAIRYVQECTERLSEAGGTLDEELQADILRHISKPGVRAAFEAALGWPVDASIKEAWRKILIAPPPSTHPPAAIPLGKPPEKPSSTSRPAEATTPKPPDTPEERIRRVASWEETDAPRVKAELAGLLNTSSQVPTDLRAVALRSATRLKLGSFTPAADQFVKSADMNLASAALEYLGTFVPDQVFPFIGKYLSVPNPRMKATALKILQKFDLGQAVSALGAMLSGKDPGKQGMALACMIHFDFGLVRDHLENFLASGPAPKLFEAGLCLYQANPAPDNLFSLFKLEKRLSGDPARLVRSLRTQTGETLLQTGVMRTDALRTLEGGLEERWKKDESRRQGPKPAYAIPRGQRPFTSSQREEPTGFQIWVGRLKVAAASAFIIWTAWGWASFSGLISRPTSPPKMGGLVASPVAVSGKVEAVDEMSKGILVIDKGGDKFVLYPTQDGFFLPRTGDKIEALVVPFRKTSQGVILARSTEFRKL